MWDRQGGRGRRGKEILGGCEPMLTLRTPRNKTGFSQRLVSRPNEKSTREPSVSLLLTAMGPSRKELPACEW